MATDLNLPPASLPSLPVPESRPYIQHDLGGMPVPAMFDSTRPERIARSARCVALYHNGRYAASPQVIEGFRRRGVKVLLIDVLGNAPDECSVADREQEDIPQDIIRTWVLQRIAVRGRLARVYCDLDNWPGAQDACEGLRVRWWVANPTGTEHLVPGSDATQWLWTPGYDQSMLSPEFITDWPHAAAAAAAAGY